MQRIQPIVCNNATEDQKKALMEVRRQWGSKLNITDTMANNPAIVKGFLAFWAAVDESGLSYEDREVICMDMAVQNGCHYCVPAHLQAAEQRGVDMEMIGVIAHGKILDGNSRAALLQRLTRRLVERGGKLDDSEIEQARSDGFDDGQLIAIVAEIAHCHFTNSFNRLVNTESDAHFPSIP